MPLLPRPRLVLPYGRDLKKSSRPVTKQRCVGLGLELGVRVSLEKGLAALTTEDVSTASMTKVFQKTRLLGKVGIALQQDDQALVLKMTQVYRGFLGGLGVNLRGTEVKMLGVSGQHDGIGDFFSPHN